MFCKRSRQADSSSGISIFGAVRIQGRGERETIENAKMQVSGSLVSALATKREDMQPKIA
jgi:hypothetical protein